MASQEHLLRVRIAQEHRRRDPDPDLIKDLRRQHAVVRIEDSIRGILAAAPPITLEQRRHLVMVVMDDGSANVCP